jgi:hypothetical protein
MPAVVPCLLLRAYAPAYHAAAPALRTPSTPLSSPISCSAVPSGAHACIVSSSSVLLLSFSAGATVKSAAAGHALGDVLVNATTAGGQHAQAWVCCLLKLQGIAALAAVCLVSAYLPRLCAAACHADNSWPLILRVCWLLLVRLCC